MASQTRNYNSREALLTRVDYIEGKLDAAIKDFKESTNETRRDFKESMQQMEARHQANFTELKSKAESSRRWSIGTVVTIALAVIGFILTNGFQISF